MQPILSKDSAKNRFSEGKENIFSFLSVRFLFKSSEIQIKKRLFYIYSSIFKVEPIGLPWESRFTPSFPAFSRR